jgi:hypothetical protein
MTRPIGRTTVQVVRAPLVTNSHGNDAPDWASATRTPVPGCYVEPGTTQENLVGRDEVLVAWTVYAPAGVDVLATDRIEHAGVDYEVFGQPAPMESFTGALDHTVILLKRWEG